APTVSNTGLNGKPQRVGIKALKQEWASKFPPDNPYAKQAVALRDKITKLEGEIKGSSLSPADMAQKIAELDAAKQELENIIQLVDSDAVPRDFLVWFVKTYAQSSAWSTMKSLYGEYLDMESYRDVTNGEIMTANKAMSVLATADADLLAISDQWATMGSLYSLDPAAEGKVTDRNKMIRIKQAMAFLINLRTDPKKLAKMNGGKDPFSRIEFTQLKTAVLNYYNVIRFGTADMKANPGFYFDYVFNQKGIGTFNKYDIDILIMLLRQANVKGGEELLKQLKALKEDKSAFNADDTLKMDKAEKLLLKVHKALFNIGGASQLLAVGDPNAALLAGLDDKQPNVGTYLLPFTSPDYLKRVIDNFPFKGDNWGEELLKQASQLPAEAGLQFVFQQVSLRYRMIYEIYVDLPMDIIRGRRGPGSLVPLALFPRLAPLWYRDFFEELQKDKPNYAKALAILWAINYMTMSGGWRGVWGQTLTLDKFIFDLAKKVPGLENKISQLEQWAGKYEKTGGREIVRWFAKQIKISMETGQIRGTYEMRMGEGRHPALRLVGNALKIGFDPWGSAGEALTRITEPTEGAESARGWRRTAAKAGKAITFVGNAGWMGVEVTKDFAKRGVARIGTSIGNILDARATGAPRGVVGKFRAAGGTLFINGTDIVGAVKINEKGVATPTGEGGVLGTSNLIELLKAAAKGSGNVFGLYQDGKFGIKIDGKFYRVAEIRVMKDGPSGYQVVNDTVTLFLNRKIYEGKLDIDSLTEYKPVEEAAPKKPVKKLSGKPVDADANQKIVDSALPRAKAIRAGKVPSAATGDGLLSDIVTEHKAATGQLLRHVQLEALILASEGVEGSKNTLFQIGTGEGKSWLDLYTALDQAKRNPGKKIYIITTDDKLIEQLRSDYNKVKGIFDKRGVKVGFRMENEKGDARKIYENNDIVVVNIAQHAFDYIQMRDAVKPGIMIADEVDAYAIEQASTNYVISDEKGRTGNPVIDFWRRGVGWSTPGIGYKGKWAKAYKVFIEIMKNPGEYIKDGRLTEKGIDYIRGKLGRYDAFVSMQFKAFLEASQLLYEKGILTGKIETDPSKPRLSDRIKFVVQYTDGKNIVDEHVALTDRIADVRSGKLKPFRVVPQEESGVFSPNKVFGRGLNEALNMMLGVDLTAEHITLADVDIRTLFEYHTRVIGFSGSIGSSGELISNAYPDMNFKVVEMPSFIPKVEIELEDIKDPVKLNKKLTTLREKIRTAAALSDTAVGLEDVYAKVLVKGASPEDIAKVEAEWAKLTAGDADMAGKRISVIEWGRVYIHGRSARYSAAAKEAIARAKLGQPVLICLENSSDLIEFKTQLAEMGITDVNLLQGEEAEFNVAKAKASKPGTITLTFLSRGLDISVADIVDATATGKADAKGFVKGGLHIISLGAKTRAKIVQQLGRGGRSAFPGSGTEYSGEGDQVFEGREIDMTGLDPEAKYNLYEPGNADLAGKVDEAFQSEYQKNYESMVDNFERSDARKKYLSTVTDLATSIGDRMKFAKVAVDSTLDFVFDDLDIRDGEKLTPSKRAALESVLSRLTGGYKIKIGIPDGEPINRKALKSLLSDKLLGIFKDLRQSDATVEEKLELPKGQGYSRESLFKMRMEGRIGEVNGTITSELEDLAHEGEAKNTPAEMERLARRGSARLLSGLMGDLFGHRFNLYNMFRSWNAFRTIDVSAKAYEAKVAELKTSAPAPITPPTAPEVKPTVSKPADTSVPDLDLEREDGKKIKVIGGGWDEAVAKLSPEHQEKLLSRIADKNIAYVGFDGSVVLDKVSLVKVLGALNKIEAAGGRRVVVFTMVKGEITVVDFAIPDGTIVKKQGNSYMILDPKSVSYKGDAAKAEPHMVDFCVVMDGKAHFHGGWQSVGQLETAYGEEAAARILGMRTQLVQGNYSGLFKLAKGLVKVNSALGEAVMKNLEAMGPDQLSKITPEEIKLLTSLYSRNGAGNEVFRYKAFGAETEAAARKAFADLGMDPKAIDQRIYEIRRGRLEYIVGKPTVEKLIKAGLDITKAPSVEELIRDIGTWGQSEVAGSPAEKKLEGYGLKDKTLAAEAKADYQVNYQQYQERTITGMEKTLDDAIKNNKPLSKEMLSKYKKTIEAMKRDNAYSKYRETVDRIETKFKEVEKIAAETKIAETSGPELGGSAENIIKQLRLNVAIGLVGAAREIGVWEEVEAKSESGKDVEFVEKVSKMSPKAIADYLGISVSKATQLKFAAEALYKEYKYMENQVNLAKQLGMDFTNLNATKLSNMVYKAYAEGGEGWKYFSPEKLSEFFASEEGVKFLKSPKGQEFIKQAREIAAKQSKGMDVTVEWAGLLGTLVAGWGVGELADVMGIKNPQAKFIFTMGTIHLFSEGQLAGAFTAQNVRELARGINVLGRDLYKMGQSLVTSSEFTGFAGFRQFMGARFTGRPWLFGEGSLAAERGGIRAILGRSAGRFFKGAGTFTIVMKGMEFLGSKLGLPTTGTVVSLGYLTASGILVYGVEKLIAKKLAETLFAKVWQRVLGPVGIALFAVDMVDLLIVRPLSDPYKLSVYDRARAMGGYDGSNAERSIEIGDCAKAYYLWTNVIGSLRGIVLNYENYDGSTAPSASFFDKSGVNASNVDMTQAKAALLKLFKDNKDLRETIKFLRTMKPGEIASWATGGASLLYCINAAKTYFNDDGNPKPELLDEFITKEVFKDFTTLFNVKEGDNYGIRYLGGNEANTISSYSYRPGEAEKAEAKKKKEPEPTSSTVYFKQMVNNVNAVSERMADDRIMKRVGYLYNFEAQGKPIPWTAADKAAGIIRADGSLDHTSRFYLQFAARQSYLTFTDAGVVAKAIGIDGDANAVSQFKDSQKAAALAM
ncbi:MAG TPA: DEAD/DEAH box helicase family protein, partial [Candidatus Omnitrophota bacterium]|nr:DEAD/DEAH box helicase family protein [Candidatus Omnitrophota bacterium]